jgi:adenosylcobinamide kinase/adenosylcobinamide-phosphate guanylyltransferase
MEHDQGHDQERHQVHDQGHDQERHQVHDQGRHRERHQEHDQERHQEHDQERHQERGRFYFITGGARSGKSEYAEQLAAALGRPVVYVATAEAGDPEMAERIALHRRRRPVGWETVEEPRAVSRMLERIGQQDRVVIIDCLTLLITNLIYRDRPCQGGCGEGRGEIANLICRGQPAGPGAGAMAPSSGGGAGEPSDVGSSDSSGAGPGAGPGAGSGETSGVLLPAVAERTGAMVMDELRRLADIARGCRAHVILVSNEVGLGIVPVDPETRLFRDLAGWGNQLMAARADHALLLVSGLALNLKALHCSPKKLISLSKEYADE